MTEGKVYIYNMTTESMDLTVNDAENAISFAAMSFPEVPGAQTIVRSSNPSPYQTVEFGLSNTMLCRFQGGVTQNYKQTVSLAPSRMTEDIMLLIFNGSMTMILADGDTVTLREE
jgi:hypothetical protein